MKKINNVLIIGSGPIVIGQAAEFDYSGTQACLALKEEGIKTIVINPNPATIQTDKEVADKVYFEPLSVEALEKIIIQELPDGIIGTVGGQTGLNLLVELDKKGILEKYHIEILGTGIKGITIGENRNKFVEKMKEINQPVLPSKTVSTAEKAIDFTKYISYPVIIRSAFTLGGLGSGFAFSEKELINKTNLGLKYSPINQVLIEKSVLGWGEFEYEIVRDAMGNSICICNMENINPMGVHTGDSIVVAPSQTLSDEDYQNLRSSAFKIVDALNIQGSCNVQFAWNHHTKEYFVIEVNPRLSRSSALASKATGYPIARIATKIAIGYALPDILNNMTGKTAFFEPSLDYVTVKIPVWPFDKFPYLKKDINMSMKSTGEAMAIGRNFEEAIYKCLISTGFIFKDFIDYKISDKNEIINKIQCMTSDQLFWILKAIKIGLTTQFISDATKIHPWFVEKFKNLLSNLLNKNINEKNDKRIYKFVDTCSGEFPALTPYFYSTTGTENEAIPLCGKKVIILGSGPIKIGQGIEFDYMTVQAITALKEEGIKTIVINNNPETLSTDYSVADRLYFEPLNLKYVMDIVNNEKDDLGGVICQFGGQTALNFVIDLEKKGVKILGSKSDSINKAEDRTICSFELEKIGLNVPKWLSVDKKQDILSKCAELGFPVLIRPSFVLAGEGMILAKNKQDVFDYLNSIPDSVFTKPVLIDHFIENAKEVDIDFISDGKDVVSFVLEQLEPTGIHSGDSTCVFPPININKNILLELEEITKKIAIEFKIIGFGNIQAAIKKDKISIIEINPRASRTIPFLSKALNIPLVKIATAVIIGNKKLANFANIFSALKAQDSMFYIKKPTFSFNKLPDLDQALGPVMKSTGEIMAAGLTLKDALIKADLMLKCI